MNRERRSGAPEGAPLLLLAPLRSASRRCVDEATVEPLHVEASFTGEAERTGEVRLVDLAVVADLLDDFEERRCFETHRGLELTVATEEACELGRVFHHVADVGGGDSVLVCDEGREHGPTG